MTWIDSGYGTPPSVTILVRLVYGQDRRYERKLKARADATGKPNFSALDDLWASWYTEARLRGAALEMVRA